MIKYNIEKTIGYPREMVFNALRDNQVSLNEKLPNVKSSIIVDMKNEDESVTSMSALMRGRARVPVILKSVVKPELIEWYSHQKWNARDYMCDYSIEAVHFKEHVDISGGWTFVDNGSGGTTIRISNRICINAEGVRGIPPGLARPASKVAERILYSLTGPSLNRVMKELSDMLGTISDTPAAGEA